VNHNIQVGTIINHSIGCGCNQFWQVTATSPASIVVRRIKSSAVNVQPRFQTCDYVPCKDQWEEPNNRCDEVVKRLRVKLDKRGELQIGPIKRMIWWSVWNGKPQQQYSS